MEQWLQQFYASLPEGTAYYLCIWVIAFTESLLVIGLIVPGSVLIVFSGFLAANGKGDPMWLMTLAMSGAFAGDFISYALGARFGPRLLRTRLFKRYRKSITGALALLHHHGIKTIMIGRFLGPLRPFVPFAAGCAGMQSRFFIQVALVGAVLWGLAYPGLGYVFGTSWQRVQLWSGRFSLLLVTIALLWVGATVLKRYFLKGVAEKPPE